MVGKDNNFRHYHLSRSNLRSNLSSNPSAFAQIVHKHTQLNVYLYSKWQRSSKIGLSKIRWDRARVYSQHGCSSRNGFWICVTGTNHAFLPHITVLWLPKSPANWGGLLALSKLPNQFYCAAVVGETCRVSIRNTSTLHSHVLINPKQNGTMSKAGLVR